MTQETHTPQRLDYVFDGFPTQNVPSKAADSLARFCTDMDALGRVETTSGDPLVDEHTLRTLLRRHAGNAVADRVVGHLPKLPGPALRSMESSTPIPDEVPWFALAANVVVFDPTPNATFNDLTLPSNPELADIVSAVHDRFPSLEDEFLDPTLLPMRIGDLLGSDERLQVVLSTVVRQLGWWAALTLSLLAVPVAIVKAESKGNESLPNVWPLAMYLMAAAVGGWTLTVVGSCILAPSD